MTQNVERQRQTITGGTLQGASGQDLVVHQYDAAGSLTIGANIVNNGTATALTKAGPGLLVLTGSNSYTGTTYVSGGTLQAWRPAWPLPPA